MKLLEYKIAWIDDQPERANAYYQQINNRLGRYGFCAKVDWISKEGALNQFLNGLRADSDYDLIMVDWKLGRMVPDGCNGTSVSKQIRMHNSFATIIFYSAERTDVLQQKIASQFIDGVFCINREHLAEEAMNIIKASIRKLCDLTAMRGLFLGAVAEFDDVIRNSAIKACQDLPREVQQPIKDKLVEKSERYFKKKLEETQKIDKKAELVAILQALHTGSKELADCLIEILSTASPSSRHVDALKRFGNYEREILMPRNDMAHLKEIQKDGRRYLERGDREWDATKFDQLRCVLLEHHENIRYIHMPLIDELIAHVNQTIATAASPGIASKSS
jgi:hypothetical protein